MVEQEGLADVFDFGNGAFEVEGFGEDDFEDLVGGVWISMMLGCYRGESDDYLLDIDTVTCAAEDETCSHCFGESASLRST